MPGTPRRSSSSAGAPRRCWRTTTPTSASRSTSSSGSAACSRVTRRAACRSCGRLSPWPPASRIPRRLVHAGACAGYLGEEATEHELYGRAAARAREDGAVAMLPYVLEFLARAEAVDGRYAAAAAHASEGLALAHETGQQNSVCHLHASLALIAALRGREERVPRRTPRPRSRSATARGLGYQAALADWALGPPGSEPGQARGGAGAARRARGGRSRRGPPVREARLDARAGRGGGARGPAGDGSGGARRVRALRARDGAAVDAGARRPLPRAAVGRRRRRAPLQGGPAPARRGRASVRPGAHRARLRRVPAPRRAPQGGAAAPARRAGRASSGWAPPPGPSARATSCAQAARPRASAIRARRIG